MKVAFIVQSLNMGGLEKVTVHIANELSETCDVDLILISQNHNFYEINKRVNIIEGNISYSFFEKVKRLIHRKIYCKNRVNFPKEIKYLKSLILSNKYSTVIAVDGNNSMIINEVAKELKDIYNFNFISWVHNNYDTYFNNYFKNYKADLNEALSNSACVVTLTKHDQKSYSQCNVNTVTIYNPITITQEKTSNVIQKEILFVARLVKEHKGLDYLVEIARKIKGSGWIIRVLGDGEDRKWLEEQIKENDLNKVLVLHGSVKENIEQYYQNASIFISTSKWEGLPLVMIEAISSGLPVISFNHSGAVEILGQNVHGLLIDMGDINTFYDELKKLMDSQELRNLWSRKSIERSKDFKIDYIREKWSDLLK